MTLTEFLLARIEEDEGAARTAGATWGLKWKSEAATAYGWRSGRLGEEPTLPFVTTDDEHGSLMLASVWPEDGDSQAVHVALHDPARVLAECEAKRRIIEWWMAGRDGDDSGYDTRRLLTALALPYADHPDYDETWRP